MAPDDNIILPDQDLPNIPVVIPQDLLPEADVLGVPLACGEPDIVPDIVPPPAVPANTIDVPERRRSTCVKRPNPRFN